MGSSPTARTNRAPQAPLGFSFAAPSATTARTRAVQACSSNSWPSRESMLRQAPPSRAALKKLAWVRQRRTPGEGRLDVVLVAFPGPDDAGMLPDRTAAPFSLLDHLRICPCNPFAGAGRMPRRTAHRPADRAAARGWRRNRSAVIRRSHPFARKVAVVLHPGVELMLIEPIAPADAGIAHVRLLRCTGTRRILLHAANKTVT